MLWLYFLRAPFAYIFFFVYAYTISMPARDMLSLSIFCSALCSCWVFFNLLFRLSREEIEGELICGRIIYFKGIFIVFVSADFIGVLSVSIYHIMSSLDICCI